MSFDGPSMRKIFDLIIFGTRPQTRRFVTFFGPSTAEH